MTRKQIWWVIAIVLAAIITTYFITKFVYQFPACCTYPGNKDWIDYISAFSGPLAGISAIIIAIWSNSETNKRQEKARIDQIRDKEIEEAQKIKNIIKAIIQELKSEAELAIWVIEKVKECERERKAPDFQFNFSRPIFEAARVSIPEMPITALRAISMHEASVEYFRNLTKQNLSKENYNYIASESGAKILAGTCVSYIATLSYPELSHIARCQKIITEMNIDANIIQVPPFADKVC